MKLKSLLSATFLLLGGMSMYAEDTDISAYTKAIYIESGSMVTIDSEGNAVIPIKVKNDVGITGYQFNVSLPASIDPAKVSLKKSAARKSEEVSFSPALQADGSIKAVAYTSDDQEFSGNDGEVATLTIPNAEEGTYTFSITGGKLTSHGNTFEADGDVTATVTLELVNPDDMYDKTCEFIIKPFKATIGETGTLNIYYTSSKGLKNASFDVTLPEGMYFVDYDEWDKSNVAVTWNTEAFTSTPTTSCTLGEGDSPTKATINITGIYNNKSKKYLNDKTDLTLLVSISYFAATQADIDEYEWEEGILTEGTSKIIIDNVNVDDIDGINHTEFKTSSTDVYGGETPKVTAIEGIVELSGDYSDTEMADLLVNALELSDAPVVDMTSVSALPASTEITTANPNTIILTSTDLGLTNTDNVVIGKTCENFNLTDGYDFKSNSSFNANSASYTRGINSNIGTICLPYSVSSDSEITYYELTGVEGTTLNFSKMDVVPANTPALFVKGDAGNSLNLSSSDAKVAKTTDEMNKSYDEWKLVGTFENTAINVTNETDDIYYISSVDGKFYKATGNLTIKPFRAYFRATKNSGVKSYSVGIEDETGVRQIVSAESEQMSTLYDLSGRQVNKASRGVYIQNGKKFIVK